MAEALGSIGHESSIDVLNERLTNQGRYLSKDSEAMIKGLGGIFSYQSKESLIELLEARGNTTKAAAIESLGKQDPAELVKLLSPYLVHKSRPVVRASVLALVELGNEGEDAIRAKAPTVFKRIGYDRPSKIALTKMLGISGIETMKPVHKYFAKRIEKLSRELANWQRRAGSTSYSYYWRRREQRTRSRLIDFLKLAFIHLRPPFDEDLLNSITPAVKSEMTWEMKQSPLAQAMTRKRTRESVFEQAFLSSYK
jgi:hypothetical protein